MTVTTTTSGAADGATDGCCDDGNTVALKVGKLLITEGFLDRELMEG